MSELIDGTADPSPVVVAGAVGNLTGFAPWVTRLYLPANGALVVRVVDDWCGEDPAVLTSPAGIAPVLDRAEGHTVLGGRLHLAEGDAIKVTLTKGVCTSVIHIHATARDDTAPIWTLPVARAWAVPLNPPWLGSLAFHPNEEAFLVVTTADGVHLYPGAELARYGSEPAPFTVYAADLAGNLSPGESFTDVRELGTPVASPLDWRLPDLMSPAPSEPAAPVTPSP